MSPACLFLSFDVFFFLFCVCLKKFLSLLFHLEGFSVLLLLAILSPSLVEMIHKETQRQLQERKTNLVHFHQALTTTGFERPLVKVNKVLVGNWNANIGSSKAAAKATSAPHSYTKWSQRIQLCGFKQKPALAGTFQ